MEFDLMEVELPTVDDNVLVRGPNLDCFVRPLDHSSKTINYDFIWSRDHFSKLQLLDVYPYFDGDQIVMEDMSRKPDLVETIGATVQLFVKHLVDGMDVTKSCTGCFVSNRYIFSVGHIFDEPHASQETIWILDGNNGTVYARNLDLNALMACQVDIFKTCDASSIPWGDKADWIDFAVLELQRPIPHINPFRILTHPTVDMESTIVALGFPGLSDAVHSLGSFSTTLQALVRRELGIQERELNSLLTNLFHASFDYFRNPVAAFGSPLNTSNVDERYYIQGNYSSTAGMSGSPIVAVDNPNILLGIHVGGIKGLPHNLFLDVQTPLVQWVYQRIMLTPIG